MEWCGEVHEVHGVAKCYAGLGADGRDSLAARPLVRCHRNPTVILARDRNCFTAFHTIRPLSYDSIVIEEMS